jgi:hypothetical protein
MNRSDKATALMLILAILISGGMIAFLSFAG